MKRRLALLLLALLLCAFALPVSALAADKDYTVDAADFTITLNSDGNSYSLVNEEGNYLYASAVKAIGFSSSEQLWTLSDTDNGVSLTYGSNGTILYNVSSPRFTTYTSNPNASMLVAYLYVEDEETPIVKQDATLTFSTSSATATLGQSFTAPSLSTDPAGIAVSYSSSDESVAALAAGVHAGGQAADAGQHHPVAGRRGVL